MKIKKNVKDVYEKLMKQDFGGTDVDSALMAEAFQKGIDYLFAEDYVGCIREWKKALEKKPLEKKLKDYIENN